MKFARILTIWLCCGLVAPGWASDKERILDNLRQALPLGLLSFQRYSGQLLLNPALSLLNDKALDVEFFVPAMVVDQNQELKLITEFPMQCVLQSSYRIKQPDFRDSRLQAVVLHIQQEKQYPVARVLSCQLSPGFPRTHWQKAIQFATETEGFKFQASTSPEGDPFYYYVNQMGDFELYFKVVS